MTWEETISYIRNEKEYKELVADAYLDADLILNVKRFSSSPEFSDTLELIGKYKTGNLNILDVGCGNGIAAVSFASMGHSVVAIDPDPGPSVGTGAVEKLKADLHLQNLSVLTTTAEEMHLPGEMFDLVYCRQAMHHAADLNLFVRNITRYIRKGGLLMTVRDHVVFSRKDKEKFLSEHPLHKFYHGENAYTPEEYRAAITMAGLEVQAELRFFDSPINFFPLSLPDLRTRAQKEEVAIRNKLKQKLGILAHLLPAYFFYKTFVFDPEAMLDEKFFPGRMYSYLAVKK
jgi:2-polyprenyl-3-methyl-5-hydroxy-6-metoxy-1,4-benzoquinol methylase